MAEILGLVIMFIRMRKNRDYSKIKNKFDRNIYEALDHLYSTGALNVTIGEGKEAKTVNIMDEMINDKKNTFTINEQTESGKKNEFDPNSKSVKFNTSEGIRFRKDGTKSTLEAGNVGYNSPSSRLGHEIFGKKVDKNSSSAVKWDAQSSMIINGKASFTIKWGFTLFGTGAKDHKYNPPTIINSNKVTKEHTNAIQYLHE